MIELIPAIDLIEGKCVRLSQGKYESKKIYNDDPLEVAKVFEAHGITRLHVVDLDGAVSHHIVNYRTLERLSSATGLCIDFGGGIKTDDDLRIAFECGAKMVTGGSVAVKNPETFCRWLKMYGTERIILGADVHDGYIATGGWKEKSACELSSFLEDYVEKKGVTQVICTDISRDGMLQGPSIGLYKTILERFPLLGLVASGGVGSMEDIHSLEAIGVPAVIVGKALYEGRITLRDLESLIVR